MVVVMRFVRIVCAKNRRPSPIIKTNANIRKDVRTSTYMYAAPVVL